MYYSATPEFMNFCCKFLGRKVTSDFVEVFVWDNKPHAPCVCVSHPGWGFDSCTLKERSYENCFTHVFCEPENIKRKRTWKRRRSVGDAQPNWHTLTVQVLDGRIIRFFPPIIMDVEVDRNDLFEYYTRVNGCQLRSPTEDDLKMYAELLERCTIKGDEYDRLYVDCPLIRDLTPMVIDFDTSYDFLGPEWRWEDFFTEERIAKRKEEDEVYL